MIQQEIRKKLTFLLIGLIIFVVVAFIVLIKPIDFNKGNSNNNSAQEEVKENNDGNDEIDINSDIVANLNNLIEFSINDYMAVDLFLLYSNDILESNNIPNDIKLFMLKRTDAFEELLINSGVEEYLSTCNYDGLVIKKEDFDKVVTTVFGPDVTVQYDKIDYTYYNNSASVQKVTLSYENDNYVLRCN